MTKQIILMLFLLMWGQNLVLGQTNDTLSFISGMLAGSWISDEFCKEGILIDSVNKCDFNFNLPITNYDIKGDSGISGSCSYDCLNWNSRMCTNSQTFNLGMINKTIYLDYHKDNTLELLASSQVIKELTSKSLIIINSKGEESKFCRIIWEE